MIDNIGKPAPIAEGAAATTLPSGPEKRWWMSLQTRLLLLAAIAIIPAFVILISSQLSYRATRSAELDTYASHMTDVVMGEVTRGMTGAATMMVAMARSSLLKPEMAGECNKYAQSLQRDIPSLIDIAVAGADGAVFCSAGDTSRDRLQQSVHEMAVEPSPGRLVLGLYEQTPAGPALPMAMALPSETGTIQGYVLLNVRLQELEKLVKAAVPRNGSTIVTDRAGGVLLSVPADKLKPGDVVPPEYASLVTATERGTARMPDWTGRAAIIGYRPAISALPIATVFALPRREMMAAADSDAWIAGTIAVAGSLLAFAAAWLVGERAVRRPVNALVNAVSARRHGVRAARTGFAVDGSEFGTIGNSLDHLFDELDHREEVQAKLEEQRDLYAREVQHRVKNLLAVVQVVARQSLAETDSPQVRAFEERIGTIVRANAKLVAEYEAAGTLEPLLRDVVSPLVKDSDDRVQFSGPTVELRAKAALALAMAFHELTTNALKFGALSTLEGKVRMAWQVAGDLLRLTWTETGGPTVVPPGRSGFGSMLITRTLEGETRGKVALDYLPEGLRFELIASVASLGPTESVETTMPSHGPAPTASRLPQDGAAVPTAGAPG